MVDSPSSASRVRKTPQSFEAFAAQFMSLRSPSIGRATILEWSRALPRGGAVLDLGCGHGVPVSDVLVGEGFDVYGVDASPTLIESYAARFPNAHTECARVEESDFFGRQFDGVVSIGVILLPAARRPAPAHPRSLASAETRREVRVHGFRRRRYLAGRPDRSGIDFTRGGGLSRLVARSGAAGAQRRCHR